jgi:hypothetical protein
LENVNEKLLLKLLIFYYENETSFNRTFPLGLYF